MGKSSIKQANVQGRSLVKLTWSNGFTLIEVLLALAIIAIAFTALLKATSQDIVGTRRIKDKMISHWVATQAVQLIQLGLVKITPAQTINEVTTLFNEKWYWRASLEPTPIATIQKIHITMSPQPAGPFVEALNAYRFVS